MQRSEVSGKVRHTSVAFEGDNKNVLFDNMKIATLFWLTAFPSTISLELSMYISPLSFIHLSMTIVLRFFPC